MQNITIRDYYGDRLTTTSAHRSTDIAGAIMRAVIKRYGRHAFFWEDKGYSNGNAKFGAIAEITTHGGVKNGGTKIITNRVCITFA